MTTSFAVEGSEQVAEHRRGFISEAIARLQQRPGVWALVFEDDWRPYALRLRRGGCEVRTIPTRPGNDTHCDIYARWPESAPVPEVKWQDPPAARGTGRAEPGKRRARPSTTPVIEKAKRMPGIFILARTDITHAAQYNWRKKGVETLFVRSEKNAPGLGDIYVMWPDSTPAAN